MCRPFWQAKHRYHGNDPLCEVVDKGRGSCHGKLLRRPALLFFIKANSCVRVRASFFCVRLHVCVQCARGKGNEYRWGLFKQPGFASREASERSNPPRSRGCLLRGWGRLVRAEQFQCFPAHIPSGLWKATTPGSPRNGPTSCGTVLYPELSSHLHIPPSGKKFSLLMSIYSMLV